VAKIGGCPRAELQAAGIEPVEQYAGEFIVAAAMQWFRDYAARVARGELVHTARADAALRQGAYSAA
jgi:nitrogen fixation protein NifB